MKLKLETEWSELDSIHGALFRLALVIILSLLFLIQVENDAHCDFVHLREMILRTNLEDLRSTTHTKHYEVRFCLRIFTKIRILLAA